MVAASEDDLCRSGYAKGPGDFEADATAGTGDEDGLAGLRQLGPRRGDCWVGLFVDCGSEVEAAIAKDGIGFDAHGEV